MNVFLESMMNRLIYGLAVLFFFLGCSRDAPRNYSGVKMLSEQQASSLVADHGLIDLDGLEEIGLEVARILTRKADVLYLNHLKRVSHDVADIFSKSDTKIYCEGLVVLDHSGFARKFADLPGGVFLKSLVKINAGAAAELANHNGDLGLPLLPELEEGVAEALSKHKGRLWLSSVRHLSNAQVKDLLRHEGVVFFNSLENVTKPQRQAMSEKGFYVGESGSN